VEAIDLAPEDTFGELVTYPTITSVRNVDQGTTMVSRRDGVRVEVNLRKTGALGCPFSGDRLPRLVV
jgi:hypothetical protein